MKKRLLALSLALTIAIFPTFAFADSDKGESGKANPTQSVQNESDFDDAEDIEAVEEVELEEEQEQIKEWEALKDAIEAEKDLIESQKDALEQQKDSLEEQYEAAKEIGDMETAASLLTQLQDIRAQIKACKLEMKAKIADMHEVMKQQYTAEEWAALQAVSEQLSTDPSLTVLGVENVYYTGGQMKFDTPPVIKDGRTLIPIRSLSTALGADVSWNSDERTATIVYGDSIIEFNISDDIVYLNGAEAQIDVPAGIMNGRIVVPLRFVIENMDLEVEYEEVTQTIIISE